MGVVVCWNEILEQQNRGAPEGCNSFLTLSFYRRRTGLENRTAVER